MNQIKLEAEKLIERDHENAVLTAQIFSSQDLGASRSGKFLVMSRYDSSVFVMGIGDCDEGPMFSWP